MYELFIELTNSIFWEGYAENLLKENPHKLALEYQEFILHSAIAFEQANK